VFVIAVETLAIAIKQNSDIKGIHVEKEQDTKLLHYVDDTTAVLADTTQPKFYLNSWTGLETFPVLRSIAQKLRVCG